MTPQPQDKTPESQPDWKALAYECGQKLVWAITHIKASGQVLKFKEDGSCEPSHWEDDVIETLVKFPGAKVNRDALMEKYLSAKERAKLRKQQQKLKEAA